MHADMGIVLVGAEAGDQWRDALSAAVGEPIMSSGDPHAPGAATIALVAGPLTDSLARFEKLELVLSLQAGVEALLGPGMVPDGIQIARVGDPTLRASMVESVLLHVLSAHRQSIAYRAAQRERRWLRVPQPSPAERRVGVLGLGALGAPAATAVASLFPSSLPGLAKRNGRAGKSGPPVSGIGVAERSGYYLPALQPVCWNFAASV